MHVGFDLTMVSGVSIVSSVAQSGDLTKEQNPAVAAVPFAVTPAWPPVFASCLASALAIVVATFWSTVSSVAWTWYTSRTFSHGFLVIPIAFYLVWMRRDRLVALTPKPTFWLAPVLLLLSAIWLLGNLGDVHLVQQFALVAMLEGIVWMLLGTAVVRALWFPLAFLFFAVPFGEMAIGPLQDFTAHFAVICLRLSRVPVLLESRTIWVPSGPWVVAEACSGIRYLISSLVLGLVYASLVYRSRRRRALFILASLVVPIIANGIRAYGIILLAYLTNNRLAVGVDHIIYGWVFFTAVQLSLFSVGLRWRESAGEQHSLPVPASSPQKTALSRALVAIASFCAVVLASSGPMAARYVAAQSAAGPVTQLTLVVNPRWQEVAAYDHSWAPRLHPASEFSKSYFLGGQRVDAYVAGYSGQGGVELVSGDNRISNPRLWSQTASGFRRVTLDGRSASVRWDQIQSNLGSRLVWSWYCVGGKCTANPTLVKWLQAEARLQGRPAPAAVVSIATDCVLDPSPAASSLQDFLRDSSIAPAAP